MQSARIETIYIKLLIYSGQSRMPLHALLVQVLLPSKQRKALDKKGNRKSKTNSINAWATDANQDRKFDRSNNSFLVKHPNSTN